MRNHPAGDDTNVRTNLIRQTQVGLVEPRMIRERWSSGQGGQGHGLTDALELGQLLAALRRGWWQIGLIATMTVVGVGAWTLLGSMRFNSTARLYLGELSSRDRSQGGPELDLSNGSKGDLGSEIAIIKSRALVSRAVLASGLNAVVRPVGWEPPRYWQWRLSGRDPKLLEAGVDELKASNVSFLPGANQPESLTVEFVSADEYEVRDGERVLGNGQLGRPAGLGELSLTLNRARNGKPVSGSQYSIQLRPLEALLDDVQKQLEVWSPRSETLSEPVKVVTLTFSHSSPTLAAAFLQQLMLAYLSERQSWKSEEATAAEAFVTTQLENTRRILDQLRGQIVEYRSENPVVVLDSEADAMITQIGKYEEQRVASRLQVAALKNIKRALSGPNPPAEAYMMGEADDAVLMSMAHNLSESRQKLTELQSRFNEEAPEVKEQNAQVAAQLNAIRSYVDNRLARAQQSLGAMGGIIGQFKKKLKGVPSAEARLVELNREAEVHSSIYSYLLRRQQETALQKASTVSKNRVLDNAEIPYREDSPTLPLRMVSAPLGLVLGVLFVLFRSMTARTLQTEEDVRRILGHYSVFASLPHRKVKNKRAARNKAPMFDVLGGDLSFDYVEAFRLLRTNLYHSALTRGGQVVLITSPFPGDGKTTCILSLAAILAADGKSVLVVDSDLRKQTHSAIIGQRVGASLQSILLGSKDWRDATRVVTVSAGEFHSIDAGGIAPAELLSSDRLAQFLSEAKASYDFVLLDSPSYPLVSDALVLAGASDCVFSVLRLNHTPRRLAIQHVDRISTVAPMYALIINESPNTPEYGHRYPHSGAKQTPARLQNNALGST